RALGVLADLRMRRDTSQVLVRERAEYRRLAKQLLDRPAHAAHVTAGAAPAPRGVVSCRGANARQDGDRAASAMSMPALEHRPAIPGPACNPGTGGLGSLEPTQEVPPHGGRGGTRRVRCRPRPCDDLV